jgi:hypothetical protein
VQLSNRRMWAALLLVGGLALAGAYASRPPAPAATVAALSSPTATLTSTPSATASVSPTPTRSPTATSTPRPSATHLPTATGTATPTSSPTSLPTKQVLLQMGFVLGDGGGIFYRPFGNINPSLVVYTDGEIITNGPNDWNLETKLSTTQMCSLLRQVAATGFLKVDGTGQLGPDDPIYHFMATPEISEGGSGHYYQVNGNPAKFVYVYDPYRNDVVAPIKAVERLLNAYRPAGLKPYQPDRLYVLVDSGRDLFDQLQGISSDEQSAHPTPTPAALPWPNNLPPLADWWNNTPQSTILIQDDLLAPVLALNLPKHYGVFMDRGQEYTVAVRPLLPGEVAGSDYYDNDLEHAKFALPFQCD